MSNAFIFDGFLSVGEICFFISKNRGVVSIMTCWGKFVSFYVTSGFSSGTHNSCRLICLRFNPVKMSRVSKTFSILQCVGRIC